MNSSHFRSLAAKPFLFLLEYLFKFTAGVIAAIVLGAPGSFFGKLGAGFGSLLEVGYQLAAWPEKLNYTAEIINDYNTLTASSFNQRYGGQAINHVMQSLNEGVEYLQMVYQNLVTQPVATAIAALVAFLTFYLSARVLRFIRQRGRGSYLTRKEREIGKRVFDNQQD